jgi:hypothetical protein
MTDLNSLVSAIADAAPDAPLRRRMGAVSAINANRTINVTIGGSTTAITGVHYFGHYAPRIGAQVWLDTDGRDWVAIGAIAGSGGAVPTGRFHRTADLTVTTGAGWTPVPFQAAQFDPWGMWTTGTNVIAPITGRYHMTGMAHWAGNATSYRAVALDVAGVVSTWAQQLANGTNVTAVSVSSVVTANAGDAFRLQVRQGSGGNLTLNAGTSVETHLTVTYLGPDA